MLSKTLSPLTANTNVYFPVDSYMNARSPQALKLAVGIR